MTAERAVMLVEKVTYFEEFGYLDSSCIRQSINLMFLGSSRVHSRFCSHTQLQVFLLVFDRHVGANLDRLQYGISKQISTKLDKIFFLISRLKKIAGT